jgi:hypothetical protein
VIFYVVLKPVEKKNLERRERGGIVNDKAHRDINQDELCDRTFIFRNVMEVF